MMKEEVTLPVYNGNMERVIALVEFKDDNLTQPNKPYYVNDGGRIGLKRLDSSYGRFENSLVYMFYDPDYPRTSYAMIISEEDAYQKCKDKDKLELASKLKIKFVEEVEVI